MVTARFWMRLLSILFWFALLLIFLYGPAFVGATRKSITVFAWPGMFDDDVVAQFEKESGITVHVSYYESNEELMLKLGSGKGYDLIVPSDYAVDSLKQKGLLKKIDVSKLPVMKSLNPFFLSNYYDENNEYFVPIEWAIFGIGVNRNCFNKPFEKSWSLIFDPAVLENKPLVMTNDPFVAIPIASLYLSESINTEAFKKTDAMEKVLASQRPFVVAYTDYRASYYLVTKTACLAVTSSANLIKSMEEYSNIDFIVPREGTLVTIEGFAIPAASQKEELAYQFINFMMQPHQVAFRYAEHGFFPTTIDGARDIKMHPFVHSLLALSREQFYEKFHLLRSDILKSALSDQELQDLWVRVKV